MKKIWISVLLIMLLLFPAVRADAATKASGSCGDNVKWTLSDTGVLTISGTGAMKDYSYYNQPWYEYREDDIKKVVIKSGVTRIGNNAFFSIYSLEEVTIPKTVTSIGKSAFEGCEELKAVSIPEGVTSIEEYAFSYCDDLENVTISKTVTEMGRCVFTWSGIKTLTIQNGVKVIGECAFLGCRFETVTIPASVTKIGDRAFFFNDYLKNIKVSASNKNFSDLDGVLYNKKQTQLVTYPDGRQDLYYEIPTGVKTLGKNSVDGSRSLEALIIPKTVTKMTDFLKFDKENHLKDLYFYGSAEDCSALYNSGGVTNHYDFSGIPAKSGKCGSAATWTLTEAGTLKINGSGAMKSYKSLESVPWYFWRSKIKKVTIAEGITKISAYSFSNCKNLKTVSGGANVTSIGKEAFYQCGNLSKVELHDKLKTIGVRAFKYCWELESITLPNGLTTICAGAFYYGGLGSLKIPSTVRTIGKEAFKGNEFKSVTIPSGVTSIGDYAFSSCYGLKSVTWPSSATTIQKGTFKGCNLTDFIIPNGVKTIQKNAFADNEMTSVTIPGSVTKIEEYAFSMDEDAVVYFLSTKTKWKKIDMAEQGDSFTNAELRCVVKPSIKTQPANVSVSAGKTASFNVSCGGTYLSYQWYYRTSSSGSWTKVKAESGKTAEYSLKATARHNGYQYRCVITNKAGTVTSSEATLTVK